MQVFRQIDPEFTALVGFGVRVMLLAPEESTGHVADRIAGFGGMIETETELFGAIESLIGDATGFGLFVMECDSYGGIEAGRRAIALLNKGQAHLPAILISRDCKEQIFPEDGNAPILLRAPLSAVSLRVGFEHALRDRLVWRAA